MAPRHLFSALLLLAGLLSGCWGAACAGEGGGGKMPPDQSPEIGALAPDFELVRLDSFLKVTAEAKPGEKARDPEKVKLSSFRGKRPVVLVLSSYT
jgi:hypothetical protein